MLEHVTNTEGFKVLASLVTGGAFVGWLREHRKGKKDAYAFALDMLEQQNGRMDRLTRDLGILEGKLSSQTDALTILKQENNELRIENTRLKTALGEHERHSA